MHTIFRQTFKLVFCHLDRKSFFYGIKTIIKAKLKKNKEGSFKFENICSVYYIYTLSQHRKVVEVFNDENRLGIQCGINVEIWFGFQR